MYWFEAVRPFFYINFYEIFVYEPRGQMLFFLIGKHHKYVSASFGLRCYRSTGIIHVILFQVGDVRI